MCVCVCVCVFVCVRACVCVFVYVCITIRTTHTPDARPDAAEHGGPGLYTVIRNAIHK
jgi:hypothetical protein